MHQSTLRKVDVLANIMGRVIDGSLKTHASWFDKHGVHPKIILEFIAKHWIFALITGITGLGSTIYTLFF